MKLNIMLLATLLVASPLVMAAGEHSHSHDDEKKHGHSSHDDGHDDGHDKHQMSGDKKKMFLKKKSIDGYDVSFHIMPAKDGMKMGDESHHLMIKVEQNGKELTDVKINSKVVHPNGKADSKMLMKMGGWFMAGYDLGHEGKHKVMILFKTADGKKHSGGVHYTN